MGEIDTKPIEPVQVARSLFGEKGDQHKHGSGSEDLEKERHIECLLKDLANYKVQLEAKDSAYLQLQLKLEQYQKSTENLSVQLKNSEVERNVHKEDCREARIRINELDAKVKEMGDQIVETGKLREKLSHVLSELKATQGEILAMETELAAAREAKLKALTQAEMMETAANIEKERAEELVKRVAELNEAILMSQLAAIQSEKEKCLILSEKDAQLEAKIEAAAQAQEQVEEMRKQLETMQELENQLLAKSVAVDSLQMELNQAFELLSSLDKAVSEAVQDFDELKAELEVKERENSDQAFYIVTLETELKQVKLDLKNSNEGASQLKCDVEMPTDELQKGKTEMGKIKERENAAQTEIALLKSELDEERSELVAAAEAGAGIVKSGLYLALQQLTVKTEEANKEIERFTAGEAEKTEADKSNAEAEDRRENGNVMISVEAYEFLIRKAEKADKSPRTDSNHSIASENNKSELDVLKKELELATAKIGEFRTRAEQAITRAEAAERAKIILEEQQKRWRERRQRRKDAMMAIRRESRSRDFSSSAIDTAPKTYQPLSEILNMKF